MQRVMLKSKVHRATVIDSDLHDVAVDSAVAELVG
jgi:aspartate 1-decarboxylase